MPLKVLGGQVKTKILLLALSILSLFLLAGCINITVEGEEDVATESGPQIKEVLRNVTEQYFEYEQVPFGPKTCQMKTYNFTQFNEEKRYVVVVEDGEDVHYRFFYITITNHEDKAGAWEYYVSFRKEKNTVDRPDQKLTVGPGETGTLEFRYSEEFNPIFGTQHMVDQPMIEKCAYQEPITYKRVKVVKNRTIEKLVNITV